MKKTITIILLFFSQIFISASAQNFDFELLDTYKVSQLPINFDNTNILVLEQHQLPEGKAFLIVTGNVKTSLPGTLHFDKKDIQLKTESTTSLIGSIDDQGFPVMGNGFFSFQASNNTSFFSSIFVIDAKTEKTSVVIKGKEIPIGTIPVREVFQIKHPQIKVANLKYLPNIELTDKYRGTFESYIRKLIPINGKILKLDLIINPTEPRFIDDPGIFSLKTTDLKIVDENNNTFACLGYEFGNNFVSNFTTSCKRDPKISINGTFYFAVSNESKFKILHLGQVVSEF